MDFLQGDDHTLDGLRSAVLKQIPNILLTQGDEDDIPMVDNYWDSSIRSRLARKDHVGVYHRIKVAAEGEGAFVGFDRIFRADVEGEPIGLLASSAALMGFTQVTHYAMTHAGLLKPISCLCERRNFWGPVPRSGNRIAARMQHDTDVNYRIARIQIMDIADWVNNHRRMGHA